PTIVRIPVRPAREYARDRCHRLIADLLGALEDDQRALLLNPKTFQRVLCRIEIDLVDNEARLFLLDLLDDRALSSAGRTPRLISVQSRSSQDDSRDTKFAAESEKVTFDVKYFGLRPQTRR